MASARMTVPTVPTENDILCGRGRKCFEHDGNRRFRKILSSKVTSYVEAGSRKAKTVVVRAIVEEILGYGARFLKKNARGHWYDTGVKGAKQKVGHSLRDAVTDRIKCLTKRTDSPIKQETENDPIIEETIEESAMDDENEEDLENTTKKTNENTGVNEKNCGSDEPTKKVAEKKSEETTPKRKLMKPIDQTPRETQRKSVAEKPRIEENTRKLLEKPPQKPTINSPFGKPILKPYNREPTKKIAVKGEERVAKETIPLPRKLATHRRQVSLATLSPSTDDEDSNKTKKKKENDDEDNVLFSPSSEEDGELLSEFRVMIDPFDALASRVEPVGNSASAELVSEQQRQYWLKNEVTLVPTAVVAEKEDFPSSIEIIQTHLATSPSAAGMPATRTLGEGKQLLNSGTTKKDPVTSLEKAIDLLQDHEIPNSEFHAEGASLLLDSPLMTTTIDPFDDEHFQMLAQPGIVSLVGDDDEDSILREEQTMLVDEEILSFSYDKNTEGARPLTGSSSQPPPPAVAAGPAAIAGPILFPNNPNANAYIEHSMYLDLKLGCEGMLLSPRVFSREFEIAPPDRLVLPPSLAMPSSSTKSCSSTSLLEDMLQ